MVSFDCPLGPRDIITTGTDGILVPEGNLKAMALALDSLMVNRELRERMGCAAQEGVQRFHPEAQGNLWEEVIRSMTFPEKKGKTL